MKLYLAGPMRGIPKSNFPAFDAAAEALRAAGHTVFNPADHDRKCGLTGGKELTHAQRQAVFKADTNFICTKAEGIALLPGWSKSLGAKAEKALAEAIGLSVIYLPGAEDPTLPAPQPERYVSGDSAARKRIPMASGLLDYFPDALAAIAEVSWLGNQKHNPGEPLHHARGKSADHADCIMRHLVERGGFDTIIINGVAHQMRHSAALAWRANALLQEELEAERGLNLPRGAKAGGQ